VIDELPLRRRRRHHRGVLASHANRGEFMETPYALYDALSAIDVPPEKIRVVVQSMERDMALYATQSQFTALDQHSGSRFELLDARFAQIDKRFEQIDRRFEQIEKRFEQMERRFEQIDDRFEQIERRFEQIEKRFEQIDKRFEQIDKRFDLIDGRFDAMQRGINDSLQTIEQRLIVRLGSFLAVAVVVTAGLLKLLSG
jgi:uncharacterized protein (DUF3084 family)